MLMGVVLLGGLQFSLPAGANIICAYTNQVDTGLCFSVKMNERVQVGSVPWERVENTPTNNETKAGDQAEWRWWYVNNPSIEFVHYQIFESCDNSQCTPGTLTNKDSFGDQITKRGAWKVNVIDERNNHTFGLQFLVQSKPTVTLNSITGTMYRNATLTFDADGTVDNQYAKYSAPAIQWRFGDGSWANGSTVTHAYSAPGTYLVKVRTYDGTYYSGWKTRYISITDPVPENCGPGTPYQCK